jgi:redox-sensitive bicupin YhaK (pirin superfamily)
LPAAKEEMEAAFAHYSVEDFPMLRDNGKSVRVVVGSLYGERSPVKTTSETMFADVHLAAGSTLPLDPGYEERAIYVLDGKVDISGDTFGADRLLVFKPGDKISIRALTDVHLTIFGGATMDGPRHIWWNFVSSRKDRIEQAKAEWAAGHFGKVPGDEIEFIPLPET